MLFTPFLRYVIVRACVIFEAVGRVDPTVFALGYPAGVVVLKCRVC